MLSEALRTLVRKHAVYDVPEEMAACLDCDTLRCPDVRYATCPNRQARAAERHANEATCITRGRIGQGEH